MDVPTHVSSPTQPLDGNTLGRNVPRGIDQILGAAGIRIGGDAPWDLTVHDHRLFNRVSREGTLGLGEAYVEGWWDCPRIDALFDRLLQADADRARLGWFGALWGELAARTRRPSVLHYESGNDLFEAMLDRRMIYSCALWNGAATLDEAQEAKLDLICRKLRLTRGHRVLDIGCGWGGFAQFAADRYGAEVVGITLSDAQARIAAERNSCLPVEIRVQDYREITGVFDRVVSIGMVEHVGVRNYRTFMRVVSSALAEDGLFLLHTIGSNESSRRIEPWLGTYIFPDACLPSIRQLAAASEGLFVMEDWHNLGAHYDATLLTWQANLDERWHTLPSRYDERFQRMWRYYLLSCAGTFRARKNQLWQVVFSKHGVEGGYDRVV